MLCRCQHTEHFQWVACGYFSVFIYPIFIIFAREIYIIFFCFFFLCSTCALLTGLTAISLIKISPPTRPHLKGNSGVRKKDCKLRCQSVVCQQQLKREATSQIKNSSSSAFPPTHTDTNTHTHRERHDSCFMNSYNFSSFPPFPSFFLGTFCCFYLCLARLLAVLLGPFLIWLVWS